MVDKEDEKREKLSLELNKIRVKAIGLAKIAKELECEVSYIFRKYI